MTNNGEENMGLEFPWPDRFSMQGSRPSFPPFYLLLFIGPVSGMKTTERERGTNGLGWDPGVHADRIRN